MKKIFSVVLAICVIVLVFAAFPLGAAAVTVSDDTELVAALAVAQSGDTISITGNMVIGAGVTVTIPEGVTVNCSGDITNNGSVFIWGSLNVTGGYDNTNGQSKSYPGSTYSISGTMLPDWDTIFGVRYIVVVGPIGTGIDPKSVTGLSWNFYGINGPGNYSFSISDGSDLYTYNFNVCVYGDDEDIANDVYFFPSPNPQMLAFSLFKTGGGKSLALDYSKSYVITVDRDWTMPFEGYEECTYTFSTIAAPATTTTRRPTYTTSTAAESTTTTAPAQTPQPQFIIIYAKFNVTLSSLPSVIGTDWGKVDLNTELTLLDQTTDHNGNVWYMVKTPDGRSGWFIGLDVSFQKVTQPDFLTIWAKSSVILRSLPSSTSKNWGAVTKGTPLILCTQTVDAVGNVWYLCKTPDGRSGWFIGTTVSFLEVK